MKTGKTGKPLELNPILLKQQQSTIWWEANILKECKFSSIHCQLRQFAYSFVVAFLLGDACSFRSKFICRVRASRVKKALAVQIVAHRAENGNS